MTRREFAGAAALSHLIAIGGYAATALPRNLLLKGKSLDAEPQIPLRAGPLTAVFEPGIAFLRYVRFGDREILRGLYAAVRDKTWGTVAPRVSNIVAETRSDSFRLTFDVDNVDGDIDFGWRGVITGEARGVIRFEFNGRARSTFLKNRVGFAVLHPIKECAGKPCMIEKASGIKEPGTFPDAISPHQPFIDMAAISHEIAPGVMAEVRFEGDLFEMEDHRNWTDNNYKTYCTPLARPYPVELQRGQEVKQAVTIKLTGAAAAAAPPRGGGAARDLLIEASSAAPVRLPSIGLGYAADQPPLTVTEATRLRVLRPSHLRVDVKLSDPGWQKALNEASRHAPLELAVLEGDPREIASKTANLRIARWLFFDEKLAAAARPHLRGAPQVVGVDENFTELNRGRPQPSLLDGACYPITPQMHAFDDRSIVENLEAQADTVRSAHRFLNGKPVHVTPVTLRPRLRGPAQAAASMPKRLPSSIDVRQASLLGAVWTLASIKYLAENKPASITYYQTHGWAGVMETAAGAPMPELFPSIPGAVFPLYHVLADVAEFAGGLIQPLTSSDPLETCALALESTQQRRRRLLIANLTDQPKVVTLDAAWIGPRARIASLDETNAENAMRQPERFRSRPSSLTEASGGRYRLALLPYGITRLDRVS